MRTVISIDIGIGGSRVQGAFSPPVGPQCPSPEIMFPTLSFPKDWSIRTLTIGFGANLKHFSVQKWSESGQCHLWSRWHYSLLSTILNLHMTTCTKTRLRVLILVRKFRSDLVRIWNLPDKYRPICVHTMIFNPNPIQTQSYPHPLDTPIQSMDQTRYAFEYPVQVIL